MKCLKCNSSEFVEQNVRFDPEVKGKIVEVIVPCKVCKKCETPFMSDEQMNVLRRASADKYKKSHNLLTSSEIVAIEKN